MKENKKLAVCTMACNLIAALEEINDQDFVDEVINCISGNDTFTLGTLAGEVMGEEDEE